MTLDTDFHSHVSRSSAREMAQAACARGLRVLGLSEHVFQMNEGRLLLPHLPQEGPFISTSTYIEAVQTAGRDLQIDVRLGLEVDFIPEKNEAIQKFVQGHQWDFLIGSVHEVDGVQFEKDKYWKREEGEALWLHYFALLRKAVSSGYFSLVSHPVRMRRTNPYLPASFDEELEQLAAEATRCDVALEINGYDIDTYPTLVRRLAKACMHQQTPVSVGSDAHIPRQVAQAHAQSEALLREVGINKVRIWKQGAIEEYEI